MKTRKSKKGVANFIVDGIQTYNYHEIPENFSEMKWHIRRSVQFIIDKKLNFTGINGNKLSTYKLFQTYLHHLLLYTFRQWMVFLEKEK